MAASQSRRPRRKKKRGALYVPLSIIIICLALVFGLSVFFKVSVIEVEGAAYYTAEEIIAAAEIQEGDNLFFINTMNAAGRIDAKLPYIDTVSVSRQLPNRVVITVTESRAVAYVTLSGTYWTLSSSGRILGEAASNETSGLIEIIGFTPEEPTVGETVAGVDTDSAKVSYLIEILSALTEADMTGDVTEIDMSNVASPGFDYLGRFTVKLGQQENVAYKLEMLRSAVAQLAEGDTGTIDLSIDKEAHFSPN